MKRSAKFLLKNLLVIGVLGLISWVLHCKGHDIIACVVILLPLVFLVNGLLIECEDRQPDVFLDPEDKKKK